LPLITAHPSSNITPAEFALKSTLEKQAA
jgi:hypothetical protein